MSTKRDSEIEIMECSAIWMLGTGFVLDLGLKTFTTSDEFLEPLVPDPITFNRPQLCPYESVVCRKRARRSGGKYSEHVREILREAFNGLVAQVGDAKLAKPSLKMKKVLMDQTHLTIVSCLTFFFFRVVFYLKLKLKQEQINNWFSNERRRVANLKHSSIK